VAAVTLMRYHFMEELHLGALPTRNQLFMKIAVMRLF
jgi:hypothetical protein